MPELVRGPGDAQQPGVTRPSAERRRPPRQPPAHRRADDAEHVPQPGFVRDERDHEPEYETERETEPEPEPEHERGQRPDRISSEGSVYRMPTVISTTPMICPWFAAVCRSPLMPWAAHASDVTRIPTATSHSPRFHHRDDGARPHRVPTNV